MLFLEPLGLIGLLAIPAAVLLAFLARRERRYQIASLLPWQKVLALPRPKPTRNPIDIETICSVLAPLAAVFALAGPILQIESDRQTRALLVIDTSPSMLAKTPEGVTRIREASRNISSLGLKYPDVTLDLYQTATGATIVTSRSAGQIAEILSPQIIRYRNQSATRLREALSADSDATVIWVSDRPAPFAADRLAQIIVGTHTHNAAILNARLLSPGEGGVFAAIGYFAPASRERRTLTVELRQEQAKIETKTLRLLPGETAPVRFAAASLVPNGAIKIRIDIADALADDNQITIPAPVAKTAVVGSGLHKRFTSALELVAGITVIPPERISEATLAVAQTVPQVWPRKGIILVAPQSTGGIVVSLEQKQNASLPRIEPSARPLNPMAIAGLRDFSIRPALLKAGREVLATAQIDNQPCNLVASWESGGKTTIYLGAAPDTWTSHPGFAVMIAELASRLLPSASPLPGLEESDTTMRVPPTTELPVLRNTGKQVTNYPLAKWLALSSAIMISVVAFKEWWRGRKKVVV